MSKFKKGDVVDTHELGLCYIYDVFDRITIEYADREHTVEYHLIPTTDQQFPMFLGGDEDIKELVNG